MRPYFWRIVICLTPILLSLWAVWHAFERDTFKLGVDLSGGTILVYEIDTRKQPTDGKSTYDPKANTNLLAEQLKRRIDPNDLYNVSIRPAGADGRVEIILPIGNPRRAEKAQQEWDELLKEMKKEYELTEELDVPRGRIQELANSIQRQIAEKVWQDQLFKDSKDLQALVSKASEFKPLSQILFQVADVDLAAVAVSLRSPALAYAVSAQPLPLRAKAIRFQPNVKTFHALVEQVKTLVNDFSKEKEINYWFKQQAWAQLLKKVEERWPKLKQRPEAFKNIDADSIEELVGRVEMRGNGISQAFLNVLEPMLGRKVTDANSGEDDKSEFIDRKTVSKFVEDNYGPSLQSIEKKIEEKNKASGRVKDLTVEEVQRIKDLVAKVGKLEFRILANQNDDADAINKAKELFKLAKTNEALKAEMDNAQLKGLPPPGPRTGGATGAPQEYTLKLARGDISRVTYSWVELGPQERQQLHLNNQAKTEPGYGSNWADMAAARVGGYATQLKFSGGGERFWLNGALFYSRNCEDRNLPEEERRKKQFEYFVLTRNPEKDEKGVPKEIDGKYLTNAANQPSSDGRPAVSFTFNAVGGRLFGELTGKNVPSAGTTGDDTSNKRHLAIVLDGLVMSAPTINSQISTHGQISGSFTNKEVDALVNILRAGALPATLKPQPVSESTMGATLGQDTIRSGIFAIVLAFVAILLFMLVYYRFAGLVACIALLANLLLTVAFMAFFGATFTLPGLAGLVLTLGMAVDANVLIYERLREERERGANLLVSIRQGYERALPTIIDTHLTSIFMAVVLYVVGNDQLKGFGVSLTVGLLISLFTSLYMTRLMFDLWQHTGWLKKLSMMRLFGRPDFDFMGIRYYWFTATIVLTIFGMVVFIGRLPGDLNIDFVGGTAYGGELREGMAKNTQQYRTLFDETRQAQLLGTPKEPKVRVKEVENSDGHMFTLEYEKEGGGWTEPRTVTLANKAVGETAEARAKNVQERSCVLPDWSVELIFPSKHKEADPDSSRFFNVRTSEKEAELVQATLDRLLREKNPQTGQWADLLKKVTMTYDVAELERPRANRETHVGFYESDKPDVKHFASPSFVKTLLSRELVREFQVGDARSLPFSVDMIGEGKTEDGRYTKAKMIFNPTSGKISDSDAAKIKAALDTTVKEFRDRPQPERLETFDSQLAADTRLRALYAVLLGWGAILLYLWFRFGNWTFGAAAVICLVHDLFFTMGLIACCHYVHNWWPGFLGVEDFKLDLTAVAALLTLVGYSVSDTIVVFDRIREVRGKNPDLTPQMINDSVNQTLSRTILSSLSVWLVVSVLYVWGGPGVHLFAFVMVVGVIVGTYSSIYIASPLLLLFGEGSRAVTKGREGPKSPAPGTEVVIQPAQ